MKKVVNAILIFLLVILVLLLTVIIATKQTVLDEQFVMKRLESLSYYEKVADSLRESFQENIIQSGIEVEFAEELVDNEKIKNDINGVIHSIYTDYNYEVSTDDLKDKLNAKIDEIANDKGAKMTTSDKQAIQEFLDIISETYTNEIYMMDNAQSVLHSAVSKINSYLPMASIAIAVSICVIAVIMLIINRNIKFVSITLFANAMLLIIGYIFIHHNININYIKIFTEEFSMLLRTLLNDYVALYLYTGIGALAIGFVTSFFVKDEQNKVKKAKHVAKH